MRILLAAAAALLLLPAAAHAAPPANDARTAAAAVTLPASVAGTTREATLEADEPSSCAPLGASVWYSLTAADTTRIVVRLAAAGDLDATVDVFQRTRSQLTGVTCEVGDAAGQAEATFKPIKGATYLIRVGQRANSVPGDFRLDVAAPVPAPTAPGAALPAGGATHTLDRVQDTADAYAVSMSAGHSYRINLSQPDGGCVSLALYPAGTRGDFDSATAVKRLRCGGYLLYTPRAGEGGRFSLYVSAQTGKRGPQPYRLDFAAAGADDTSPGLPLANYEKASGSLSAVTIDVVDLYRFSVTRRSDLKLTLRGHAFDLQLLSDKGKRLGTGEEGVLEQRIPARPLLHRDPRPGPRRRQVHDRARRADDHAHVGEHAQPRRAGRGDSGDREGQPGRLRAGADHDPALRSAGRLAVLPARQRDGLRRLGALRLHAAGRGPLAGDRRVPRHALRRAQRGRLRRRVGGAPVGGPVAWVM